MSLEKILFDAHNRGIRKDVLEQMDKYKHLAMEQKTKAEKAYNDVVTDLIAKGTLEQREWESSLIQSTTYNYEKEILTVEFNNHQEYTYEEVSFTDYKEFCDAESQGKHFLSNIRNSKKYQKVDDVLEK